MIVVFITSTAEWNRFSRKYTSSSKQKKRKSYFLHSVVWNTSIYLLVWKRAGTIQAPLTSQLVFPERKVVFYQYEEQQWNKKTSYFSYVTYHLTFCLLSRGETDKNKAQNTVLALGWGKKKPSSRIWASFSSLYVKLTIQKVTHRTGCFIP